MYDWTDDFRIGLALNYPTLRGFIMSCDDVDKLLDFVMALETDRMAA
jgi:hypothetical protein